jgi:hypothetical protein
VAGGHNAEQALDVLVDRPVLAQRHGAWLGRVVDRVAVEQKEVGWAHPAVVLRICAYVARVLGHIGADGEEIVMREEFVHVVMQPSQIGGAIRELETVRLKIAGPRDGVLGIDLLADGGRRLTREQAEACRHAAAADLPAVLQNQRMEKRNRLGGEPEIAASVVFHNRFSSGGARSDGTHSGFQLQA